MQVDSSCFCHLGFQYAIALVSCMRGLSRTIQHQMISKKKFYSGGDRAQNLTVDLDQGSFMKTRTGICRGVAKVGRRMIYDGCSGRHVEVVVSWISVGGLVCLHINICEWTNSVNGPGHGCLVCGYLRRLEQGRCKGKYQKRNPRMNDSHGPPRFANTVERVGLCKLCL